MEAERIEAVHSAINKFVVYEKFAEMSSKYDVENFSKLLDTFSTEEEVQDVERILHPEGYDS